MTALGWCNSIRNSFPHGLYRVEGRTHVLESTKIAAENYTELKSIPTSNVNNSTKYIQTTSRSTLGQYCLQDCYWKFKRALVLF
jgi:hypothetical protein